MDAVCPACGCAFVQGVQAHRVRAALQRDDLDAALELGLLDIDVCGGCDPACTSALLTARSDRVRALAARARYQLREARLAQREQARNQRRMAPAREADGPATSAPTLPAAAAAALARAKARVATRR